MVRYCCPPPEKAYVCWAWCMTLMTLIAYRGSFDVLIDVAISLYGDLYEPRGCTRETLQWSYFVEEWHVWIATSQMLHDDTIQTHNLFFMRLTVPQNLRISEGFAELLQSWNCMLLKCMYPEIMQWPVTRVQFHYHNIKYIVICCTYYCLYDSPAC